MITKNAIKEIDRNESFESPVGLAPESAYTFRGMSENGKKVAEKIYEGIQSIPGAKWLIGKIGIAYNENKIFDNEKSAAGLKDKLTTIENESARLTSTRERMASMVSKLEDKKMPGGAAISLQLRRLDEELLKLQNKQDQVQSKLENKNNRLATFTNKRDAIAENLIQHYEQKLYPFEAALELLNTERDRLDLRFTVVRAEHAEINSRINETKAELDEIKSMYADMGMSAKEIMRNPAVQTLENIILAERQTIQDDEKMFAKEKASLSKVITNLDARAQPARDNRNEFIRIKENRPLIQDIEPRTKLQNTSYEEEVSLNTRESEVDTEYTPNNNEENSVTIQKRNIEKVGNLLVEWNHYIATALSAQKPVAELMLVSDKSFYSATSLTLDKDLPFDQFGTIITAYYKYRKITVPKEMDIVVKEFISKKISQ